MRGRLAIPATLASACCGAIACQFLVTTSVNDEPPDASTGCDASCGAEGSAEGSAEVSAEGGCVDGDTTCDPHNCGGPGHDCLGGACTASQCQPVLLFTDKVGVLDLALDDENVYWLTYQAVRVLPKDGGSPRSMATFTDNACMNSPKLVVQAGSVFWCTLHGVHAVPVDGGSAATLFALAPDGGVNGIAGDGTSLFWASRPEQNQGRSTTVTRLDPDGAVTSSAPITYGVNLIAVTQSSVLLDVWGNVSWDQLGSIPKSCHGDGGDCLTIWPVSTCDETSTQNTPCAVAFAVSDAGVYWQDTNDNIFGGGPDGGSVVAAQIDPPDASCSSSGLQASGPWLYASACTSLERISPRDGGAFTIARSSTAIQSVAVDRNAAYWLVPKYNQIYRVALPP